MIPYFFNDSDYGRLVQRFSDGTTTKDDITFINSCLICDNKHKGGTVELSKEDTSDVYYVCEKIKREILSTKLYSGIILIKHIKTVLK